MAGQVGTRRRSELLIVILIAMALMVGGVGYLYYARQQQQLKDQARRQLQAIGNLKVQQIVSWRRTMDGEAGLLAHSPLFAAAVDDLIKHPRVPTVRRRLVERLRVETQQQDFVTLLVLDPKLRRVLGVGRREIAPDPSEIMLARRAVRAGRMLLSDLRRGEEGRLVKLGWAIPIFTREKRPRLIAVVLADVDPYQFLYPLMQTWPIPSASGETLLVERRGDKVVYLNELRHRRGAALSFSYPIATPRLPAAMAARGVTGLVDGADYLGHQVLADIRHVPQSPWYLVAKVDQSEVYAPARQQGLSTAAIVLSLILVGGLSVGLLWRAQTVQNYKDLYRAGLERSALERHFEYLTRYANDMIFLADSDLRLIEVNDRACEAYGHTRGEFLKLTLSDLQAPSTRQTLARDLETAKQEGGDIYETEHVTKEGSVFPVEVSVRRLDIEGQRFYQSIVRDISERKQIEQLKSDFTSMVSHELRTPLTAIVGYATLLEQEEAGSAPQNLQHVVERIKVRAMEMNRIVDDLLNINRIESGQLQLKLRTADVAALVRACADAAQLDAGHHLELDLDEEATPVRCDPERLGYAVSNLISNAIKFSPQGGTIGVSAHKIDGVFVIRVTDEGVGIPAADIGHVFDRFTQADMSSTRAFGGFGMGLFIAREVVEAHGGTISAENRPDRGSAFTIEIPIKRE